MKRNKRININIQENIEVKPGGIYISEVVKSGNGAVVKFFKRFIGKKVMVLIIEKMNTKKENNKKMSKKDLLDIADYTEDAYLYDKD